MRPDSPWAEIDNMDPFIKAAIREKREAAGLTQGDAAAKAGMSDVKVWGSLERDGGRQAAVGWRQIEIVAETVGCSPADLYRKATELRNAGR